MNVTPKMRLYGLCVLVGFSFPGCSKDENATRTAAVTRATDYSVRVVDPTVERVSVTSRHPGKRPA